MPYHQLQYHFHLLHDICLSRLTATENSLRIYTLHLCSSGNEDNVR